MSPGNEADSWPLERYRAYLRCLAGIQVGRLPRAKFDASDLVQEAMLKAHSKRVQYRGASEAERLAWLRRILANTLADLHRRFAGGKRDARLERSLEQALDQSSTCMANFLADKQVSPDGASNEICLAEALAELPESQRTALTLRYLSDPPCSLADIALQLGRTEKAAAGLLSRGLETLRERLKRNED
jgi:RNA polymerase sigma-70 factor (ECF subfamily)